MIPKVIHYCWFGGKSLPPLAKRCIKSWKKYLPDYEIKEWNEDNFNINAISYTQEAYKAKRYAFVSDYVRFYVLYHYGGVYFDTDVEIIQPIDDIIKSGAFMGCETAVKENVELYVAPGLGLGFEKHNALLKVLLDLYSNLHFINADGSHNLKTIVQYTTDVLVEYGFLKEEGIQRVKDIWIYPKDYFNPYDCETGKFIVTKNTRTIHYFAGSWKTKKERFMDYVEKYWGSRWVNLIHKIKILICSIKG